MCLVSLRFPENLKTRLNPCRLGDERSCSTIRHYSMNYNPKKPDLVFDFRYHSLAMLQALRIIPPPKCEVPQIIDLTDEDILPPPKRQKTTHNDDLTQSMQVRNSWNFTPVRSFNDRFNRNRGSWNGYGTRCTNLKRRKPGLRALRRKR